MQTSAFRLPVLMHRLSGTGLKTRLLHPHDAFWDHRLAIDTVGYKPDRGLHSDPDWRCHYSPTAYREIFRMLTHAQLGPNDVFVDLGCGLGRAVFAASQLGARRAIGVEIDEELADGARANQRHSRLKERDIEFECLGAEAFTPTDCTVVFIYNAFGAGTLQAAVDHLTADVARNPRDVRIVYFNPTFDTVLERSPALTRFDHWTKPPERHPVSFWRMAPRH